MPQSPFDIWDEMPLFKFKRYFKSLFFITVIVLGLFGIIGG
jgi:hypothetical protein